jgi:hypothetical protein
MGYKTLGGKMRLTPRNAVKEYCLWCCKGQWKEVNLCPASNCPLHKVRGGKNTTGKNVRWAKLIKDRCFDCNGFEVVKARECQTTDCQLWEYRKGKNKRIDKNNLQNVSQAQAQNRFQRRKPAEISILQENYSKKVSEGEGGGTSA